MKNRLFLLLNIFFISLSIAQAPEIAWQKSYGGSGYDYATSIKKTPDGGYIVAGYTSSVDGDVTSIHGGNDFWVLKLDADGNIQWQKTYGGPEYDTAESICLTTDGGYIVAGESTMNGGDVSGNHGGWDFWVIKIDSIGVLQWQTSLGGYVAEQASSIQQTSDGGYIVTGYADSFSSSLAYDNWWVVKLSSTGVTQWSKVLGSNGYDFAKSVQQTIDGGYIVSGYAMAGGDVVGNHGDYDFWVVKLSSTGVIQWQKTLGGTLAETGGVIKLTNDGGYVITGQTRSNNGDVTNNFGGTNIWVVKLSSTGTIVWQKVFGGSNMDFSNDIVQTTDNGYLVCGYTLSSNGDVTNYHGNNDAWVFKLSATGILEWQRVVGGSLVDQGYGVVEADDGGTVLVGYTKSSDGDITAVNHGNTDFLVTKLYPSSLQNQEHPDNNALVLFPNPTDSFLNIKDLTDIYFDEVNIYGVNGIKVLQQNNFPINVESLASGMYFAQIISNGAISTHKFIKR